MKRVLFFLLIITIVSCRTSRPVIATTKSSSSKQTKAVVKTTTKPAVKNQSKTVAKSNPSATSKTKTDNKTSATKPSDKVIVDDQKSVKTPDSGTNSVGTDDDNSLIIQATSTVKVTPAMVVSYINQFKEIAKSSMFEYGVPASITLAQGILESGTGQGALSKNANNHFGIKCNSDWTGESVRYTDDAENECFRKYEYPSQSYRDHSMFLSTKPRYATLFELEKNDYKEWAKGLRAAGYATDPDYPNKLIKLIERFQLNRFDNEVLGLETIPTNTNSIAINNQERHQVSQGDTLYSISKRYNISVDELKRKNNIFDGVGISIGQFLIVK